MWPTPGIIMASARHRLVISTFRQHPRAPPIICEGTTTVRAHDLPMGSLVVYICRFERSPVIHCWHYAVILRCLLDGTSHSGFSQHRARTHGRLLAHHAQSCTAPCRPDLAQLLYTLTDLRKLVPGAYIDGHPLTSGSESDCHQTPMDTVENHVDSIFSATDLSTSMWTRLVKRHRKVLWYWACKMIPARRLSAGHKYDAGSNPVHESENVECGTPDMSISTLQQRRLPPMMCKQSATSDRDLPGGSLV